MARQAQLSLVALKQKLLFCIMAVMAFQTVSFAYGLMYASDRPDSCSTLLPIVFSRAVDFSFFNRLTGSLTMTVQTDHLRWPGKQFPVIACMHSVAGRTLFLQIGLMHTFLLLPGLVMAGQAEGIGCGPGDHSIVFQQMTGIALPPGDRCMDILFQKHRLVGRVWSMTLQASSLGRISTMGPDKGFPLYLMTGTTEVIRSPGQQRDIAGRMRIVTGSASFFQRGMDIFFLKKTTVMATKTCFSNRLLQQMGETTVMGVMTTAACSGSNRLMNGFPPG